MRAKIIKVKTKIIFFLSLFIVFLSSVFTICMDQVDKISFETKQVTSRVYKKEKNNEVVEEKILQDTISTNLVEYENFPIKYRGFKVVGKINIPKLEIEKYILEETTEETLKAAVTKTCGPKANEIGNFCISGHNYQQTFGKIKDLEIGDKIIITDTYNREVTYEVYAVYKVDPTDTSCLSQDTKGEREVTLITCTLGAIKRNIVKAIEVYD